MRVGHDVYVERGGRSERRADGHPKKLAARLLDGDDTSVTVAGVAHQPLTGAQPPSTFLDCQAHVLSPRPARGAWRFPLLLSVEFLSDLLARLRDLPALVQWAGYVGLSVIIFTETGLLIGFFLPGDSLLVTAGLLCSQPAFGLNVYLLGLLLSVAAILGDTVGYHIGRVTGPRIFTREDSFFFRRSHLLRAQAFYEKHGGKTIIIARFVPIVRTFAPVVAGVGQMQYRSFLAFNVVGGLSWVWGMLFTGYFLGRWVPGIDQHIEKVILVVIFLSILPGIIAWARERFRTVPPSA